MEINDRRHQNKVVTRDHLESGKVYVTSGGNYVIVTDERCVVTLDEGVAYSIDQYDSDDEFTPVNARLEIY